MTEHALYFEYGETETEYLKSKDPRLAEVIDRLGHIERVADNDLFTSVIHHIVGQQISESFLKKSAVGFLRAAVLPVCISGQRQAKRRKKRLSEAQKTGG